MPGSIPRSARVPHTEKRPKRCPHCGSIAITRKGTRRKKIEIVQLWRCASCKRVFTPTPAALRGKTYPLRIVLDAITLYDLGYSLEQTAEKIRARHGHRVGRLLPAAVVDCLSELGDPRVLWPALAGGAAEQLMPLQQARPLMLVTGPQVAG